MKKIIVLIIAISGFVNLVKAQQDAMFTHYMYNTLWLNPAYAGTRDALTITGIHRSQWVNFDGAPLDQSLTAHMPILNGKGGVGLSILNDQIGVTKSTMVALDLAYNVRLDSKSKLGFGLKGLVNFYRNNLSQVSLNNQNDNAFAQNQNLTLPNAGAGVYYYRERFYAGFSTPKLLENELGGSGVAAKETRHFFFILGTLFNLNKDLKFKPTMFARATKGAPLQGEITGTFIIKDKINLAAMYRTGDAVGALVGYNFTDQFYAGYSFDWSMANTTGKHNAGSHEVMLRYDLIYKAKAKIKSPRYF